MRTLPAVCISISFFILSMVLNTRASNRAQVDIGSWTQRALLQQQNAVGFGYSTAVSGKTAVLGSQYESNGTGAAYVFSGYGNGRDVDTQAARLTASDGAENAYFGKSVAISGDTIVVGSPGVGSGEGKIYLFVKPEMGWTDMTETAQLQVSDGDLDDLGVSIAIEGDTVVAGANSADKEFGAAFVYVKPQGGWVTMKQTAKLRPGLRLQGGWFGEAVAISGGTIAVGAPLLKGGRGVVFIFVQPDGGWTNMAQTAAISANGFNSQFGSSVAINGNTLVVGAPSGNLQTGVAYLYVEPQGGWKGRSSVPTAILTSSDGRRMDKFATSVAISGNTVFIGAPNAHCVGFHCRGHQPVGRGAVYYYTEPDAGWQSMTETAQLLPHFGMYDSLYGQAIAVDSSGLIVGTPNKSAAYYFSYNANLGFTAFLAPNSTYTSVYGVNNTGGMVGYDDFGAFVENDGVFETIAYPGAETTIAFGINDAGDVVGTYYDGSNHGFVENGGVYKSIDCKGGTNTQLVGINNARQMVGNCDGPRGNNRGFLLSRGTFISIDPPGAHSSSVSGINNSGQVVGTALSGPFCAGFLYDNGMYTRVKYPNATCTYVTGVNDQLDLVGTWQVSGVFDTPSFAYSRAARKFVSFKLGNYFSEASGVNNSGEVVGSFTARDGSQYVTYGFYGTPSP